MTAPAGTPGSAGDAPVLSPGLIVARCAAMGLLIALPAAFVQTVLSDQTPKPQVGINLLFLAVLVGFLLAGFMTGRSLDEQVAKRGALAGFIVYLPIEVIAVLGRLDRGDPVTVGGIVIIGLLAACLGTVGARVGARKHNQGEHA